MGKKATIVGAGLVGSLWSILLAKRGYEVTIYERRADMRKAGYVGGRSINLALSDRGFRGLERAGIADAVRAVGIPMYGRMMHDTAGNLVYQAYGKDGQAIYSVSRGGLNLELINLAEKYDNVKIKFSERCEGTAIDTGNTLFVNDLTQEKTSVAAADNLIFATDGAFSTVRADLQKRPRFNYSQQFENYGYKELTIAANADGSYKMEQNALHIWPRGHFMLIALPNLDGSFTCTLFLGYDGAQSFANLHTAAQINAFFEEYFADAKAMMPTLVEEFQTNGVGSLVTIRCRPWNLDDKVLLFGDAAHAIVPFYGQGMNSGFEDCVILDDMMDEHAEDWTTIFESFGASRPDDADGIAELALRNFIEMRDLVGDPQFLLRQKIAAWLGQQFPDRFVPLYSLVTFSAMPYSEALREAYAQDRLFDHILKIKNVEAEWNGEAVVQAFETWQESGKV